MTTSKWRASVASVMGLVESLGSLVSNLGWVAVVQRMRCRVHRRLRSWRHGWWSPLSHL